MYNEVEARTESHVTRIVFRKAGLYLFYAEDTLSEFLYPEELYNVLETTLVRTDPSRVQAWSMPREASDLVFEATWCLT